MTQQQRRLIWVPIVHSQADLGSLGQAIHQRKVERVGVAAATQADQAIQQVWRTIRTAITNLQLPLRRVRLYQDGLPVCEQAREIVRETAAAGSPNHRLLEELIAGGATLMGTESPELLLREYELARRTLAGEPVPAEESQQLLQLRDRFIAQRIADTLQPGEFGLLFLGALHSLEGKLPTDIKLIRLAI